MAGVFETARQLASYVHRPTEFNKQMNQYRRFVGLMSLSFHRENPPDTNIYVLGVGSLCAPH